MLQLTDSWRLGYHQQDKESSKLPKKTIGG